MGESGQGDARARRLSTWLPDGSSLAHLSFQRRHRLVLAILVAHVPFLWAFGIYGGEALGSSWVAHDILHVSLEVGVLVLLTGLAAWPGFGRRLQATFASLALVTSSALLTHFSGGFIEAHFHFFVVLALIAFYQDWLPFSLGILYVALHHGLVGTLAPASVYNHAAGVAAPWAWAFIHAGFILALAAALVTLTQFQLKAESQREAATDGLRREQQRLRLVLENTGSAVFAVDADGISTMVTGVDMSGLGRSPQAMVGRPVEELFGSECPDIARYTRRALAGESLTADVRFGDRALHTMYRPKWDPTTGRVEGAIGCVVDVTERVRTEKAERLAMLQQAKLEHFRSAERFRRRLFNTAAHELNTPLTPIQIQLEVLRSGELGELTDAQARALEVLERNLKRVGGLAKDLLDVARIQNARLELFLGPTDLAGLVKEGVESFHASAKVRGVRLVAETEPRLIARADAGRITQVITNLLSNALKFTPEGGTIRVSATRVADDVRVQVTDTGRGLTAEEIERLFVAFGQVENDEGTPQEGSGLGLYISRGIVERHGGRIWAESKGRGEGSTFAFELPVDPSSARPAIDQQEAETEPGEDDAPERTARDTPPGIVRVLAGRGADVRFPVRIVPER